jgi:hypothetical protein
MMWTRRQAVVLPLAAGACATAPGGPPLDAQFTNIATPSESVHSGVASEDGEQRLTVRLCRYPELGLAWVWVHARVGGEFYSFVDHMAPCGTDATPDGETFARYRDTAGSLVFERLGAVNRPAEASIVGKVRARKSATSAFGAGEHDVAVRIRFTPARLYSGLNAGRTEVFGKSTAKVTIDGKEHVISGPAQFHEQRQTNPRFTAPFCYMSLWGDGAASTMLIAPKRRDGYLLEGDKSTEVETMTIDPPAPRRAMHVQLADGRKLEGEARVVQAYTIPLVGNTWRGHMVDVELGGKTYRGHVNDYIIGDGVPYLG